MKVKKKFNFLINTIIFANLFFLFFVESINAKPRCEEFYEAIYNDPIRKDVNQNLIQDQKTIGIRLLKTEDKENNWVLDKSRDGYFRVGKITKSELAKLIFVGDEIVSINDIDLRDFSKDKDKLEILNRDISDIFEKNEAIKFKIRRYDKNLDELIVLEIDKGEDGKPIIFNTEEEFDEPILDFYVKSININDKEGYFDASIQTDFLKVLDDRYQFTKEVWDKLVYEKIFDTSGKYLDNFYFETCVFSDSEWHKLNSVELHYGLIFDNLIKEEKQSRESSYYIEPYLYPDPNISDSEKNIILYKQDKSVFRYDSNSVYKIKNNFNLKNFPFDKQKISIFIRQDLWDISTHRIGITSNTLVKAKEFKQENSIQGWNIKDVNMNYKLYEHPLKDGFFDGFKLEFEIERKSNYYLFKIILPIILILIVCWSALWIPKKELESRLTITVVCLLSLIAYNFVIDSDLPKLEYLTLMDYFILTSYVFSTIPTFLAIFSVNNYVSKHKFYLELLMFSKKYGLLFYFLILFLIFLINISLNFENTSTIMRWISLN